jgi:23S rRNA pseudouridine2604 synthase
MTERMNRPRPGPQADTGIRLARRVAELVPCSRREAELYIEGGWVRVDGRVVELPQSRVLAQQKVEIDPAALTKPVAPSLPVTIVLHKPPGAVADAPPGTRLAAVDLLREDRRDSSDRSGIRPLQRHFRGLECVTPLETGASGLLVFTQDWRVGRKLMEDAARVEHEVIVDVRGDVSPQALRQLNEQPVIQGRALLAARVSISRQADGVTGLRFALRGYQAGQLADRCAAAGLQVTAIRRIRIGRLPLAGLPDGHWRYLMPYERF